MSQEFQSRYVSPGLLLEACFQRNLSTRLWVTGGFSRPLEASVDAHRNCSLETREENRMLGKESSKDNKLNEYFRRRCSNYERFLCDRVWECALCAKQAGKVETLELATVTKVERLRRGGDDGTFGGGKGPEIEG